MNRLENALFHTFIAAQNAEYPLLAWEEIALWYLLPYWGISQAWWKASKRN